MIPKTFIRKYGENLSSSTLLKLPKDAKWKVELTYHNGEVWLRKGWKEFAECFSLKQGHLLVFRFEDNSHFHMFIFDESTTETDYPLPIDPIVMSKVRLMKNVRVKVLFKSYLTLLNTQKLGIHH